MTEKIISSLSATDAIRREWRALGYIKGKNIVFESRNAEDKSARLPTLIEELLRLSVPSLKSNISRAAFPSHRRRPVSSGISRFRVAPATASLPE